MALNGELRPSESDVVDEVLAAAGDDAMRVVAFFDTLLEDDVDAAGLVRRAATFAGCRLGIRMPTGAVFSAGPSGSRGPALVPGEAGCLRLRHGGEVWLHRTGGPHPLDAVILRRLAVSADVLLAGAATAPMSDRASLLLEALSDGTDEVDRNRCLRGLRLSATTKARVFSVAGPTEAVGQLVDQIRAVSPTVHVAPLSEVLVVLAAEPAVPERWNVPVGAHVAWSRSRPALDAPAAWREARTALRFTLPSSHPHGPYSDQEGVLAPAERVGCFLALGEHLRAADIAPIPDVRALDRIEQAEGRDTIPILEAVAATESLRRAASYVHLHHNSVATRVQRAENVLGFTVTEPYGRSRLLLALVLRRLRDADPAG